MSRDASGAAERGLRAWVEQHVGGRVVRIDRLARWRPAWDLDVEVGGGILPLHARGERESTILMPYRIADEAPVHDLLEAHGIPVPHSFGLCPEPYALVMDRLPGHVDLSLAADDAERERIVDEYLESLARIYAIPLDAATQAGFAVPRDDAAVALSYFRAIEALSDPMMAGRPGDPVDVFLRRWLARNVPAGRLPMARFIPYDAFQFMFDGGHVTGLIDFELAHVADPMMDLAALRTRDTIKNIGDLVQVGERYERITGIPLDHDVIDYHAVLYNALSVTSGVPSLVQPVRETDYISYLAWYVNGARWSFETIAELQGYELDAVAVPEPRPTRFAPAIRHLVNGLRAATDAVVGDDYERQALGRVGTHLRRIDEVGPAFAAADLDDLARVLGHRPDPDEAEGELLELVATAGPERDEELVRLLDARVQRWHLLIASPGSIIVRHPRLRSLRPDRVVAHRPEDAFPAGVIPGTA